MLPGVEVSVHSAGAGVHGLAVRRLGDQRARDRHLEEVLRHGLRAGAERCTAASPSSPTSTTATPRTLAVLTLESNRLPSPEVAAWIAGKCGVSPDRLFLLVAPTASLVGSVQIAARIVETGLHKMHEVGFDIATCAPASARARWRRWRPTTSRPSAAPTTRSCTAAVPGTRCTPTTP